MIETIALAATVVGGGALAAIIWLVVRYVAAKDAETAARAASATLEAERNAAVARGDVLADELAEASRRLNAAEVDRNAATAQEAHDVEDHLSALPAAAALDELQAQLSRAGHAGAGDGDRTSPAVPAAAGAGAGSPAGHGGDPR